MAKLTSKASRIRTHVRIRTKVKGTSERPRLAVNFSGSHIRAQVIDDVAGKTLNLNLGFSHPIAYPVPDDIKVTVTDNVNILIEGADKQKVGAVAADIRAYYPPEPYKGKGVRYAGEQIIRKEGKTAQSK